MRRTILIIGIVLVVLLATLFSIPVFFKSMLLEKTKSTINKQVNAEVEFAGFNMSLFRNFPKVTIEMSEVVISGRDEFQSDTLLNVTFIRAKMSLLSLFDKTGMSIEEINLIQPELKLVVGKSGNANWDLAAGSGSDSELSQAVNTAGDDKESSFELQLEKIEIKNATLVYDDRELNMLLDFSDITKTTDKFCVLRHDIEFSIDRAYELAKIEKDLDDYKKLSNSYGFGSDLNIDDITKEMVIGKINSIIKL